MRTTAPTPDNEYYYKNNPFYKAGYGLPNCTAYVYGRAAEAAGKYLNLSMGNANSFYTYTQDRLTRTSQLKDNTIACWAGTGYGHVAYIEQVKQDGSIIVSQSHYNGAKFELKEFKNITELINYIPNFQGFIDLGISSNNVIDNSINNNKKYYKILEIKTHLGIEQAKLADIQNFDWTDNGIPVEFLEITGKQAKFKDNTLTKTDLTITDKDNRYTRYSSKYGYIWLPAEWER